MWYNFNCNIFQGEQMEKFPPIEKIYEAYTAIADNRIDMRENSALVKSSGSGEKTYTVKWSGNNYSSDDSASFWQGYAGYPIIAALMLQGILPLDKSVASLLSGINWNAINKKHKRDYTEAFNEVSEKFSEIDRQKIISESGAVYKILETLAICVKRKI